jgi:hypothetical protein
MISRITNLYRRKETKMPRLWNKYRLNSNRSNIVAREVYLVSNTFFSEEVFNITSSLVYGEEEVQY